MKLIKLDRRHSLYKDGFRYAFSGTFGSDNRFEIEHYLERVYGSHNFSRDKLWYSTFTNHKKVVKSEFGGFYKARMYYIALRNEADATACILATS